MKIPGEPKDLETAKVVELCAGQLADYTVPGMSCCKGLLRLPSGKISMAAIRAEYQDVEAPSEGALDLSVQCCEA